MAQLVSACGANHKVARSNRVGVFLYYIFVIVVTCGLVVVACMCVCMYAFARCLNACACVGVPYALWGGVFFFGVLAVGCIICMGMFTYVHVFIIIRFHVLTLPISSFSPTHTVTCLPSLTLAVTNTISCPRIFFHSFSVSISLTFPIAESQSPFVTIPSLFLTLFL